MDLLAEQVVQTFEPVASDKGVYLKAQIIPGLQVMGDRSRLTQVLVNLIDNALKFTPPGGYVRLVVEPEPTLKGINVTVIDDGIGISTKDLPHIFERFYRSDKDRSGVGFGLGLPLVQGIVASHGGSISVSSQLSKGSVFSVFLPVRSDLEKT
jgi:signal transduction histidine kinase